MLYSAVCIPYNIYTISTRSSDLQVDTRLYKVRINEMTIALYNMFGSMGASSTHANQVRVWRLWLSDDLKCGVERPQLRVVLKLAAEIECRHAEHVLVTWLQLAHPSDLVG